MRDVISIIIPVYNAEKYISRCVDSVLKQEYNNIEIILVDDGSSDSSNSIIDGYAERDSRIVVVHKDNSGVSDARNMGLDIARGDYITFVDADDYIEQDMYIKMHRAIKENNADICCCGYYQEFDEYRYEIRSEYAMLIEDTHRIFEQYLRQDIRNGIFDGNWNKLIKKECISNIRYKKVKHCEDVAFQCEIFDNCEKLVIIDDLLYHYVCNGESASQSKYNEEKNSIIHVADDILYKVLRKYPDLYEEAYAFHLTWYLSLVQDIARYKIDDESRLCLKTIQKVLFNNFKFYFGNRYSKRLDQYYLVSTVVGMARVAHLLRKVVRDLWPSKDRVNV